MKKIKPCPFCGVVPKPYLRYGRWHIECQNENCPSTTNSPILDYTIEGWNMRYRPQRKEIKNESGNNNKRE